MESMKKKECGWQTKMGKHKGRDAGISLLCFFLFFSLRSQHYSGDGVLISRMTEGGKWLVQNELFAQFLLQVVYQLASPFHFSAMEIMNGVSCMGGAIAVWILLNFSHLYRLPAIWSLLLYFSSGFLLYSCGHTEYYPILLPALFLYGYCGILYLRNDLGIAWVAFLFILACGLHFGMLIALPSLWILPLLANRKRDWGSISIWLILLVPLFLIRNFPQLLGHKAAWLSPAWNFLPWFAHNDMYRYYAVFQWGHAVDWIYAWCMRSWIFWPFLLLAMGNEGWRRFWNRERLFLLIYTVFFTGWTLLWHPDLGIEADWDLFAIEAAPCLLLCLSAIPKNLDRPDLRCFLLIVCLASSACMFSHVWQRADFPRRGFGAISVETTTMTVSRPNQPTSNSSVFTLDGLNRPSRIPRIREGIYRSKFIDQPNRRSLDMVIVVDATHLTQVDVSPVP